MSGKASHSFTFQNMTATGFLSLSHKLWSVMFRRASTLISEVPHTLASNSLHVKSAKTTGGTTVCNPSFSALTCSSNSDNLSRTSSARYLGTQVNKPDLAQVLSYLSLLCQKTSRSPPPGTMGTCRPTLDRYVHVKPLPVHSASDVQLDKS
eukprot:759541-Hanusia_phi.AAC.2